MDGEFGQRWERKKMKPRREGLEEIDMHLKRVIVNKIFVLNIV